MIKTKNTPKWNTLLIMWYDWIHTQRWSQYKKQALPNRTHTCKCRPDHTSFIFIDNKTICVVGMLCWCSLQNNTNWWENRKWKYKQCWIMFYVADNVSAPQLASILPVVRILFRWIRPHILPGELPVMCSQLIRNSMVRLIPREQSFSN